MRPLSITLLLLCSLSFSLGAIISSCGPNLEGLPSGNWNDNTYSPFLCYRLTGLTQGKYTLMAWNLETVTPLPALPDCAGPQNSLCGYTTTFDNTGDKFQATREIWIVKTMKNYQWDQFHVVVRIWNGQVGPIRGVGCEGEVEECYEQWVPSTANRPPVLEKIDDVTVFQGNQVRIQAQATPAQGNADPISYSFHPQRAGMTINQKTGLIQWRPTKAGQFQIVVSAFQGEDPTLFDSQIVTIIVKKQLGLPTPKPKPARVVTAQLEKVEKDTGCRWYVTISLKNFEPGPISVIGRGALSRCGASKAPSDYYWSGPGLINFPQKNNEFTFIQNDFGNYTYIFTDSKNQTTAVNFTVPLGGLVSSSTGTNTKTTLSGGSGTTGPSASGPGGTQPTSSATSKNGGTGKVTSGSGINTNSKVSTR